MERTPSYQGRFVCMDGVTRQPRHVDHAFDITDELPPFGDVRHEKVVVIGFAACDAPDPIVVLLFDANCSGPMRYLSELRGGPTRSMRGSPVWDEGSLFSLKRLGLTPETYRVFVERAFAQVSPSSVPEAPAKAGTPAVDV